MSERIDLGYDSWVESTVLPEKLMDFTEVHFEEMLGVRPPKKGTVMVKDEMYDSPRYHKSYMKTPTFEAKKFAKHSYMHDLKNLTLNEPLPAVFQPFLDYVNTLEQVCCCYFFFLFFFLSIVSNRERTTKWW
jgi:hypothetical protein